MGVSRAKFPDPLGLPPVSELNDGSRAAMDVEWNDGGGVNGVEWDGCGVDALSRLIAKLSCDTFSLPQCPLSPWATHEGVAMFGGS